jgi:hypothetical protein
MASHWFPPQSKDQLERTRNLWRPGQIWALRVVGIAAIGCRDPQGHNIRVRAIRKYRSYAAACFLEHERFLSIQNDSSTGKFVNEIAIDCKLAHTPFGLRDKPEAVLETPFCIGRLCLTLLTCGIHLPVLRSRQWGGS